ncbi:MAG: ABC transporter permease [Paludibacteraceae bacterium]|nr:ABC transporter permease [Paludibacteraceae bacterium]
MRFEYFIAQRIHFKPSDETQKQSRRVRPAVRIATIGIALGLAVMMIAIGVVTGFKKEVREKVIGFGSHIQITSLTNNNTYELEAVSFDSALVSQLRQTDGVRYVGPFCTKPCILKTSEDFQGMVLKGLDGHYHWDFFEKNLCEGQLPDFGTEAPSTEVLVSKTIADMMHLAVDDDFLVYLIQEDIRVRKFHITGIYNTGLQDFDKLFVLCDIRQVQQLNGWDNDEVSGLELLVSDYNRLDEITEKVHDRAANRFDRHNRSFYIRSIRDVQGQIFAWLDLLDMNVVVILILMLAVSGFNMISGLLILILDKTNLIGTLKAIGCRDWSVRKIFIYQAAFLIGKGLLWGNIIGLSLCLLQKYLHVIPLDPTVYYVDTVPVNLSVWHVLGLNFGTAAIALLMLLLPSYVIAKISPAKSIRFD